MELAELIEAYGTLKSEANKLYSDYKNKVVAIEQLKSELQIKLNDSGLRSAKSTNFGVSTVIKKGFNVSHEQSVIEWLQNTPNIESDAYIGLKLTPFKTLAMQVMKETGEVIPGTELEVKETLSVKRNNQS